MTPTLLTDQITNIATTLAGFLSLAPSPAVDATFSNLVTLVTTTSHCDAQCVLANKSVQDQASFLRSQSSIAETELEYFWTKHFVSKPELTWNEMREFPYFENYKKLTTLEIDALRHYGVDAQPVLFVGGGPLPLTACIMARDYGLRVQVIDSDERAVTIAKELVHKLVLGHLITVSCIDIMHYRPTETVIILAAMVGDATDVKKNIHEHLYRVCLPETTLMCRSVAGLGELLYTPQPIDSVWKLLECRCGSCDVINTINVYNNSL